MGLLKHKTGGVFVSQTVESSGGGGGSTFWQTGYASGSYITAARIGSSITIASWGADTILFCPVEVQTACTIDQVRIYTSSVVGGQLRIGIWDNDGTNGRPGTLIAQTASTDTSGGAGDKQIAISASLTAGWYWTGVVVNASTSISLYPVGMIRPHTLPNIAGGTQDTTFYTGHTFGALTSSPGGISYSGSAAGITMRVA